jgi:carbonic anhydrase
VEHIIICGHTDCGAMKGAMDPDSLKSLPHVSTWLGYCNEARDKVMARHGNIGDEHLLEMNEENIVLQMKHIATHPSVAERLEVKTVHLHGWLYDIAKGSVSCYEEKSGNFISVEDRYAGILHAQQSS